LHLYVETCLARMTMSLTVEQIGGSRSCVDVCPAVHTVAAAKQMLRAERNLQACKIELVPRGSTTIMGDTALLAEYDLSAGVQMVVQELHAEFELAWDASASRWYDAIQNYDLLAVDAPRASADGALMCRARTLDQLLLCPRGMGPFATAMAMPDGIAVEATGWSCSFFTRAPRAEDNDNYYCRTLLGAKADVAHILMTNMQLGTYGYRGTGHQEINFDMSRLSAGWHLVCVVACPAAGKQIFYVDGTAVGELPPVLAPIFKLGNSSDGEQSWACPVRDLRLFLRPLTKDEAASFCLPGALEAGHSQCNNRVVTLA